MSDTDLARITVTIDEDDAWVSVGDTEIEVLDASADHVMAECEFAALGNATFQDFPKQLMLQIHSADGFGAFLFYDNGPAKNQAAIAPYVLSSS
jgi:hypothetical protein